MRGAQRSSLTNWDALLLRLREGGAVRGQGTPKTWEEAQPLPG